jgi:hypothetical protein
MSNFTDFFPAAGGGGGSMPIIQEFTSSGTFTPTQALIDAGGRLAFILVGAGGKTGSGSGSGGSGGFVMLGYQTLTSTTGCTVTIGAGSVTETAGGSSSVLFSSAGGTDETASGGQISYNLDTTTGPWGPNWSSNGSWVTAGNGIMNFGVGGGSANNGAGVNYYNPTYKNYGCGANGASVGSGKPSGPGFLRIIYFE